MNGESACHNDRKLDVENTDRIRIIGEMTNFQIGMRRNERTDRLTN